MLKQLLLTKVPVNLKLIYNNFLELTISVNLTPPLFSFYCISVTSVSCHTAYIQVIDCTLEQYIIHS